MKRATFYICEKCGNIVMKVKDTGIDIVCCGKPMSELIPNTVDAAQEKHLPAVTVLPNAVEVKVGSVTHPMEEDHYIEWIYLVSEKGSQGVCLHPGDEPFAHFALAEGDKPLCAFELCNKHGMWKTDI